MLIVGLIRECVRNLLHGDPAHVEHPLSVEPTRPPGTLVTASRNDAGSNRLASTVSPAQPCRQVGSAAGRLCPASVVHRGEPPVAVGGGLGCGCGLERGRGLSDLLLGVDCGQTMTKVGLYELAGKEVAWVGRRSVVTSLRPGWQERDPHSVWDDVVGACREVM